MGGVLQAEAFAQRFSQRQQQAGEKDQEGHQLLKKFFTALQQQQAADQPSERGSRQDISAAMPRIDVPVTVLAGTRDEILPEALLRREVVDRLSDARLIRVPGAGHLLPLEAPDAVAAAVRAAVEALAEPMRADA